MNLFEHGSHAQWCGNVISETWFNDAPNFTATTDIYIYIYIFVCVCVCVCTCAYNRMYVYVYKVCVYVCMFKYVSVCGCRYVSILCLFMYLRSRLVFQCPHLAILSASLHKTSEQQPYKASDKPGTEPGWCWRLSLNKYNNIVSVLLCALPVSIVWATGLVLSLYHRFWFRGLYLR
jgi:hypothetical protein